MDNSRTKGARFTVMLVVIVAHLLFLMLFDFSMRSIRKVDRMPITLLTFIKVQREEPHLDIKMNGNFTSADHAITVPNVTLDVSIAPGVARSVPRTIDLEAAAKQFTRDYLKQHPEMAQPLREKPVPILFPQSAPTPTNVDLPGGKLIQWSSSRCYVETVDGTLTDPAANGKHLESICIRPRPNKHMLDHLKPEYLKKPVEDICSKTMVGCNHSSSSSAR